jgi:nicotinic acid phosphoribosyltransferase
MTNQMYNNLIVMCDSYKVGMYMMYPPKTEYVFSYIEARGGPIDLTVFFGLQMFIKNYLCRPITKDDIDEAAELWASHGEPFCRENWDYILTRHGGRLPVLIRAIKEGTKVPVGNALVTIVNTDPECYWLTTWLETLLLQAVWYPTTVCTNSWRCKQHIISALETSCDNPTGEIAYRMHDFGFRGVSSIESAAIGGTAHLVNFMGTDTAVALLAARRSYGEKMAGHSVIASEHSVICLWNRDGEEAAMRNMLTKFGKPGAIFACVSDTYDIYNATANIWGGSLKKEVEESGATVVIRPDCYDSKTEVLTSDGWKLFSTVDDKTLIAQVEDDWTTSFVLPMKVVNQKYNGEMVRFSDEKGRLDLLVTPNHRMIYSDRLNRLKSQEARDAIHFYNKDIPRIAPALEDEKHISAYDRFLIAFQADGSYPSGWNTSNYNAGSVCGHISTRFNFQKKRKLNRLIAICQEAGLEYTVSREPTRGVRLDQDTMYVRVPVGKLLSKSFEWVKPMERGFSWCEKFIEELGYWDATIRQIGKRYRVKYDSTVKINTEIAQLVAMRAGYGATMTVYEDHRSDKFSDVYSVSISNRIVVGGQSIKKDLEQYEGTIHCVTVPSGRLVVRRNGKAIICGNSGDPTKVPIDVVQILSEKFGFTVNSKGYKVLPVRADGSPVVRVIQGDGITVDTLPTILKNLLSRGFSAENLTYGQGGGLLQKVDRDTFKFAMKASAGCVNGKWRDVYKDPITDPGKKSKRGRLALINEMGKWETVPLDGNAYRNELNMVFRDGEVMRDQTLAEIRALSNK